MEKRMNDATRPLRHSTDNVEEAFPFLVFSVLESVSFTVTTLSGI